MSRISRLVVLVTSITAVAGGVAGTARAVTWHVGGTGAFHATAGQSTLSSTGINLACPTTTATGSYTSGSFVGNVYSGVVGTISFTGCSNAGQSTFMNCGYRLTATMQPVTTTVITGNVDLTCGMTITASGTKLCHFSGSPHAVYTDRIAPNSDTLTITASTLRVEGPSCWLGTNDTAQQTALTLVMSGNGPHIHRTA